MSEFIVTLIVTAISLLIISRLPLGIEIDNIGKALIAALILGLLNAFVKPVLFWLTIPLTLITLGLFSLLLNVIIFGLAAWLVEGFRLRWGFISAILGAFLLSVINSIIFHVLGFGRV